MSSVINLIVDRVGGAGEFTDSIAVEEPLEIRLGYDAGAKRCQKTISITMRTPGHDPELAAGFLYTEGIISNPSDVDGIFPCGPTKNIVRVELKSGVPVDLKRLERHFYTSSSCGICGKTSIEAIKTLTTAAPRWAQKFDTQIHACMVSELPTRLRSAQAVFNQTGGLHASALFSTQGELIQVREDVGRHNALDKLIGNAWLGFQLPLDSFVLLLSGRASFELIQKAAMAGIQIVAAVGAPSSLAIELAKEMKMTLLGFIRENRFNVYCDTGRIIQ